MSVLEKHQVDALEQAYDLLKEHFDSSVIVVTASVTVEDIEKEATQIFWAGGYMQAVGQSAYASYKINQMRDEKPEVSPSDEE